jgi:positive regulator of sigma E activity
VETVARVRAVDTERAYLACETSVEGCGGCSGSGCALRRLSAGRPALLAVPRRIAGGEFLAAGERVVVEIVDGELLRAAGRAYLPPLAGVLAGAATLHGYAPGDDARMLLGAAAGLLVGWMAARAWLRRVPPAVSVRLTGSVGNDG